MNRMKSSYSSGLIQSSFFLVIKDDEQYSVASIATLRRKKFPPPKVTNATPTRYDAFSVGTVGAQVRRVTLTGVRLTLRYIICRLWRL